MKRLVVDVDDTICTTIDGQYQVSVPNQEVIDKLISYQKKGFTIVLHTSRNMRTYGGNVGLINANTLPTLISWLEKHEVPFDEIVTGKPWCGFEGFYIDDKAIRPREFREKGYEDIIRTLEHDK